MWLVQHCSPCRWLATAFGVVQQLLKRTDVSVFSPLCITSVQSEE